MQRDYPDLVKEMLRVVAPQRVADVLRRLAEEGVPVRNLRDAFEAITDVGGREKDVVLLTEYVRVALKREIADRYADADRSEEHTSELQSLMRISYAVFCLKNKKTNQT